MIFVHIEIENFFRVKSKLTLDLKDQGLVCITGLNGSGKSTIFEGIVWACWGVTTRGYSGDDVVNRTVGKNCKVSLWIEDEQGIYIITRYRKHSQFKNLLDFTGPNHDLTQGTPTLTQKQINKFLGIDYPTFINGPMMPEKGLKRFSAMTDREQKAIFDQALRIGSFKYAKEEVGRQLASANLKLENATVKYNSILDSILEQQNKIEQRKNEKIIWLRKRERRIIESLKDSIKISEEEEKCYEAFDNYTLNKSYKELNKKVEDENKKQAELLAEFNIKKDKLNEVITQLRIEESKLTNQIQQSKTKISKFKNLEGGNCPVCDQLVDKQHTSECIETLEKSYKSDVVKLSEIDKEKSAVLKQIGALTNDYNKAKKKIDTELHSLKAECKEAYQNDIKVNALFSELKQLTKQQIYLVEQCYEDALESYLEPAINEKNDEALRAYRRQLGHQKSIIKGLQIKIEHLKFWETGFSNKGLRSQILKTVTPYLNHRAGIHSRALMHILEIQFRTQKLLKNGETREEFSVSVTNKEGANTYNGNSKGEKGKADLAINFSLSDLVASRSKRAYPQRFLDEPFEGLDESGIEAVMDMLSGMVKDAGSIFVITHNESMKRLFPKSFVMEKVNGESRLQIA